MLPDTAGAQPARPSLAIMTASPAPASWWRRHAGVRLTTALAAAAVVAAALAVAGVLLAVLLRQNLVHGLQDAGRQRALDVAGALSRDGLDVVGTGLPVGRDRSVVQVVRGERVLVSSPEIAGLAPLTNLRPAPGKTVLARGGAISPARDGDHQLVALGVRSADGQPLVVLVAQSLEPVDNPLRALTTLLLLGVPGLTVFVAGSTFLLTGRALRPVEAIRARVEAIDASRLGQRVPVPAAHDEVGRLAMTMNDMLDRLDNAAGAQRRFVSDASHELRSPLASVKATVEVARAHPELTSWPHVADVVLEETDRLQTLVTDLLLLARDDERGLQLRDEEVDLDDLVGQEVARLRLAGPLVVRVSSTAVRVQGDRHRLGRVLRNLVDNAAQHARSEVRLALRVDGDRAVIDVHDDGDGVSSDDAERVFERFVRLDESRSRSGGGSGLGLPIARQIARAHGGDVTFVALGQIGATVRMTLPLRSLMAPAGAPPVLHPAPSREVTSA